MKRSLKRQLIALRACAIVSLGALLLLALSDRQRVEGAVAAFGQPSRSQNLGEINVERINIIDADGTLRMVLSNKDRMHPGVIDGKTIDRPRPVAGMLFFNDEGDEVGGLTYTGRERDGQRRASSGIAFDQLKQDQIVALSYSERDGQRTAGLEVWDRSDTRLSELVDKLNAANKIEEAAAREAAIRAIRAAAPAAPRRVFVGKNAERAATVSLADANGRVRLTLAVDPGGEASIAFLDEQGKVLQRMTGR